MENFEPQSNPERSGLAKSEEVAEYLGTTPNQLSRLRFEGAGPPFVKFNRSVRYRWSDVLRFVENNVRNTTEGPR